MTGLVVAERPKSEVLATGGETNVPLESLLETIGSQADTRSRSDAIESSLTSDVPVALLDTCFNNPPAAATTATERDNGAHLGRCFVISPETDANKAKSDPQFQQKVEVVEALTDRQVIAFQRVYTSAPMDPQGIATFDVKTATPTHYLEMIGLDPSRSCSEKDLNAAYKATVKNLHPDCVHCEEPELKAALQLRFQSAFQALSAARDAYLINPQPKASRSYSSSEGNASSAQSEQESSNPRYSRDTGSSRDTSSRHYSTHTSTYAGSSRSESSYSEQSYQAPPPQNETYFSSSRSSYAGYRAEVPSERVYSGYYHYLQRMEIPDFLIQMRELKAINALNKLSVYVQSREERGDPIDPVTQLKVIQQIVHGICGRQGLGTFGNDALQYFPEVNKMIAALGADLLEASQPSKRPSLEALALYPTALTFLSNAGLGSPETLHQSSSQELDARNRRASLLQQ
jgi:hypothetical protein